jgi:acetolactate synthase I/II/III large subunit
VPMFIILGNIGDATARFGPVDWAHSAQDPAAMIRDFVKWDDQPVSLGHFAESAARAYKFAMTPPTMPVALVADHELQEMPNLEGPSLAVSKLTVTTPPAGDSGAVAELARLLVGAENPVIVADRAARTPAGMAHLIELAETLQVPVIDRTGRMNFPTRHPLNLSERSGALIRDADVVVGLEAWDFWSTTHTVQGQIYRTVQPATKPGAKLVTITANDLDMKNNYQDIQRYAPVDLAIAADAEATLPSLTEAVKRLIKDDRKRMYQDRGAKLAASSREALQQARDAATYGWDASPVSTARLSAEVWAEIKNEDWSLVSEVTFLSRWPIRLWSFDKHYQFIGGAGGYGIGYQLQASTGAALANRKHGRLSVSFQNDGDFMFAPGALWTSAHHKIPLLSIMNNNRAYHQEVMEVQRMADRRSRGIDRCTIGTKLDQPYIDYSKMAQSMGVYAEGPITDPKDLGPAIRRAIDVVKRGEPALIDVITQPR